MERELSEQRWSVGRWVTLSCTSELSAFAVTGGVIVGTVDVLNGSSVWTGCTISGIPTAVTCAKTMTLTAQSGGNTSTGQMDNTCDVRQGATKICHVSGKTSATYKNPAGTTPASLFEGPSALWETSGASCPLGISGTAGRGSVTSTVVGGTTHGTVITRTP